MRRNWVWVWFRAELKRWVLRESFSRTLSWIDDSITKVFSYLSRSWSAHYPGAVKIFLSVTAVPWLAYSMKSSTSESSADLTVSQLALVFAGELASSVRPHKTELWAAACKDDISNVDDSLHKDVTSNRSACHAQRSTCWSGPFLRGYLKCSLHILPWTTNTVY
jgi:hypothetical protein